MISEPFQMKDSYEIIEITSTPSPFFICLVEVFEEEDCRKETWAIFTSDSGDKSDTKIIYTSPETYNGLQDCWNHISNLDIRKE